MAKNDETTLQNNIDLLKSKTIGFISLGCDKNRVDLEKIIYKCKDFGFKVVNNPKKANIIIVNTCSFIETNASTSGRLSSKSVKFISFIQPVTISFSVALLL